MMCMTNEDTIVREEEHIIVKSISAHSAHGGLHGVVGFAKSL